MLNKALFRCMGYLPSLWWKIQTRMCSHRPQLSFLPLVEDKGAAPPVYQASLQKTRAIREQRAAVV